MTSDLSTSKLRVGVFYDGGWFGYLWDWFTYRSSWQASPAFLGIHDLLRWNLHHHLRCPLEQITIPQAHFVQGRGSATGHPDDDIHVRGQRVGSTSVWDRALADAGIHRHDVALNSGGEVGADVLLALEAYEQALTAPLDVVVLITGDCDFIPLAKRLRDLNVHVVIPAAPSRVWRVNTDPALAAAADHAPAWPRLVAAGLKPGYHLTYPFTGPAAGTQPGDGTAEDGYRYGTINRWLPPQDHNHSAATGSGFLTDSTGTQWYVPTDELPAGTTSLPVGERVRFIGRPTPQNGKKYPIARRVHPCSDLR